MKFIPVENNVKKAIAFANTLDNGFITNVQKIKQKEHYIKSMDVVNLLQIEGWNIAGVDELRNKYEKGEFTEDDVAYINPEESGIQHFEQYEIKPDDIIDLEQIELNEDESLHKWFKRSGPKGKEGGWVDCNAPDGKGGYKSCGRKEGESRSKYPACRPTPAGCKAKGKGKTWGKTK